jgi:hypothetical protein
MSTNYGFYKYPDYSSEFYSPQTTYKGTKLSFVKNNKKNFSKARRFSQYENESKRLGDKVGPGTYNTNYLTLSPPNCKQIPLFCRFHKSTNKWYLGSNLRESILKTSIKYK